MQQYNQKKKKRKRLNFDVPVGLISSIEILARMEGQDPHYWVRTQLALVVENKIQKQIQVH